MLYPKGFPDSPRIQVIKTISPEEIVKNEMNFYEPLPLRKFLSDMQIEKAYSVSAIREKHKGAYSRWTEELDKELTTMYGKGVNVREMAQHFGRTKGAILSRIVKLGLIQS